MSEKYAKFISSTAIDRNVPRRTTWNGRVYTGDLTHIPEALAALGFVPLDETPAPETRKGFHWEARYVEADGRIAQSWVEVADPPLNRSLSKRRLRAALVEAGVWQHVKTYMEANDLWEDFSLATTLDEQDPLMQDAIAALKEMLGLTDEQIENIIAASEVQE